MAFEEIGDSNYFCENHNRYYDSCEAVEICQTGDELDKSADKSGTEQVIALIFAEAPKNYKSERHEYGFLAKQSDYREKRIAYGIPELFKKVEKRQRLPPFCLAKRERRGAAYRKADSIMI